MEKSQVSPGVGTYLKVTNEVLLAAKHEDKMLSMVSKNSSIHSTIKNLSQLLSIDVTNINEGQFTKNIKSLFEKRILDELDRIKISNTGKLTFYSTVFERFELQKYLTFPINPKKKRPFNKNIRISAHNLEIERGRYSRPIVSREERFCKYCNKRPMGHIAHLSDLGPRTLYQDF